MINRHSSRIKTMQALYSYERSEGALRSTIEKYLSKSVFAVKDQYLYLLLLAREACNLVEVYADIKATKYLPSEKDKNFSTKLLSNTLIQYLNHDNEFQKAIEKSHLQHFLDETILKSIYQKLIKSDIYNLYLNNNKDFDFEEDRKIMYFLFDEIILKDEITLEHFEDVFATWEDDAYYVVQAVREVIKKSKTELKLHIEKDTLIEKFKELDEFSVALFNKTINNKKDQLEIVKPYLQNWDIDRIANVDFLLLRMALTELLEFPLIPYKVTLNEYIEISKYYCSPKSKDFINGILDKIYFTLKAEGKIKKSGRGLQDNKK